MSRGKFNYYLAVMLFFTGAGLALSGFVRWFVLPGGYGWRGGVYGPAQTFIFDRHTWGEIHQWLAVIVLGLVLVHLCLHWDWIVRMTRDTFKSK